MELTELRTESEQLAAARSRLYQLLAMAFAFPDEDFFVALEDGGFANVLAQTCARLPYDLGAVMTPDLRAVGASFADFESEYIRLFDVG
ncbi:MAG TPA: hypothetical protein VN812_21490, partial [Candidatus Acidoferrales bacterium]|nr:hypothetical protein [Candidatus Acidoferrales bacterium]